MNSFFRIALLMVVSMGAAAGEKPVTRPVELSQDGRRWVEKTLKRLSLEEKVGQMLDVRYFTDFQSPDSDEYKKFRDDLRKYHVGSVVLTVHVDGPILLKNPPLEVAAIANQLQRDSDLPLLIAADFERGLASRVSFVPAFPDAMAFGAIGDAAYAEKFGAITAEESRAIGVHWNLFPVADVNSNPGNPIINTRSFGEDPAEVGDLVAAFIRGSRAHGMLVTVKHFPGHGDTGTDSHLGVARVEGDLKHLENVELPPFKKAIDAAIDSVMVAHLAVPALDPDPNKVATISSAIIDGVLKKQMGFKGVVVTDALEMRGLTSLYPPGQGSPTAKAAVDAVKAGNDVILWPTDLDGAFHGIIGAVRNGEIPESRIDESVRKILQMKASVDLHRSRLVDLEQVPHRVSSPEDMQFAQQVADRAVTLVRDNHQVMPVPELEAPTTQSEIFKPAIAATDQVVVIIITESIHGGWGHAFEKAVRARRADATVWYVDNSVAEALTPQILKSATQASRVIVAAYVVPVPAKQVLVNGTLVNSVGLEQGAGEMLRQVLEANGARTALISMGNPYMVENYRNVHTYICTFSDASTSELSAVKVLFGELIPRGRLPVTLPGIAERGYSLPGAKK
jgi:beta-N-acetylhexosaminidase